MGQILDAENGVTARELNEAKKDLCDYIMNLSVQEFFDLGSFLEAGYNIHVQSAGKSIIHLANRPIRSNAFSIGVDIMVLGKQMKRKDSL